MPMKRLIILLSVALPVLLSGCSDEEDILPEQREKIVSYLERTHTPTLVSEADDYYAAPRFFSSAFRRRSDTSIRVVSSTLSA